VRLAQLVVVGVELAGSDDDSACAEGRRLLQRAADDGSPYAAVLTALLLLAGRGGPADPAAGLDYLGRAAAAGVTTAGLMLGGLLLADDARAAAGVESLRAAAAAGEWSAFWLLGVAHLGGRGVPVDGARARTLMQVAADHGVVEAHLELARLHELGIGGARSADVAARHERAAADAGSTEGCVRVAERLLGRPGGVALAIPWLARAADAGSAAAAARLAKLYLAGVELPYDAVQAERWMARAKALGWDWEPSPTR